MKIKINFGGQTVEAEQMSFKPLEEPWSQYRLEDGNLVRLKIVVSNVFKLPNADPLTGLPQYIVQSSNVMAVEPTVVSVNWWKSSWHQQSTSEQLTMQLLTPPPFVD